MQQRARLWETVRMKKRIKGSKRKQRGRKETTKDFFLPSTHVHFYGLDVTVYEALLIFAGEEIKH